MQLRRGGAVELTDHLRIAPGDGKSVDDRADVQPGAPDEQRPMASLFDAGERSVELALEPFNYTKPAVARIASSNIFFSTGTYEKLKADPSAMQAVLQAIRSVPGVATVYRAEELQDRPATQSPIRAAEANSYFEGRSGDMFIVSKPYWLMSGGPAHEERTYGTSHGTPYNYDQHVPVLLMGAGIEHGEYFGRVTPADIAPTLASLCGITLATRDGRVLAEANPYGLPSGIVYSYPLTTPDGRGWKIVPGFAIDDDARKRLDASAAELKSEREAVKDLVGPAV